MKIDDCAESLNRVLYAITISKLRADDLPEFNREYTKGFSDGFKAGEENDDGLFAHVIMHDDDTIVE